jgi:hypothetical protein
MLSEIIMRTLSNEETMDVSGGGFCLPVLGLVGGLLHGTANLLNGVAGALQPCAPPPSNCNPRPRCR